MTDKNALIQPDRGQKAIPLHLVDKEGLADFLKGRPAPQRAALAAQKFEAEPNSHAIVAEGDEWAVVAGVARTDVLSSWCMARLAEVLPAGTYRREGGDPGAAAFGWITGQYRFDRYRSDAPDEGPRVLLSRDAKAIEPITAEAGAVELVRDLVNTPAEDMGPAQLEAEAEALAKAFKAEVRVARGDVLEREFPMVHMVGRAAGRAHAPRMIELEWGDPAHPRVAIVGKGVCFDSGGLDIKPSSGMLLMKKDMGGAAHALALARLIISRALPVRLHMLVPAVENAVSGNAFRPGDVLRSRAGISVEIGNTDAEGRLVLGDALARAGEGKPDLTLDFATLTGAARVAVGPDLPALFAREDATARALLEAGEAHDDPCWRLPLYGGYREYLKSDIADINNAHTNGFAGASVAALFLDCFVPKDSDWAHFDTFAWRPVAKPGRPKGGDALGLRAAWHMLGQRYG
ncbi:leucyl aminopeptidase family protein [Novosphingobium album (ex Liu et al. 2023)]|uniref:Leucyl aminopeptidase family protein n=1 Tax=Novosphingobium album (ex Liu et al. 2023) TaxID=3031130 RepID=A0ABT5WK54_9SPHN|nr:leucyl aminopeptidase family protein [Novosphingobium album (ex Liu et al. 2023)]MDE8650420.1 leucyl aminopeptidase family protein [Novosphingobium album (ex Liu et al. 2023)]